MLEKIIISIVMVILFIISRRSRVKTDEKWDYGSKFTPFSIITACVATILAIILLTITFDWFFISVPLIVMYIYLLFSPEMDGSDIMFGCLLSGVVTLVCMMLIK